MTVRTKQDSDQSLSVALLWQAQRRVELRIRGALMRVSRASPQHTRGLVRTDNRLTPTEKDCVSHLGKIKTPGAEKSNFKAERALETIPYAAEGISAGFSSAWAEQKTVFCVHLSATATPSWRTLCFQGTFRNVCKHACLPRLKEKVQLATRVLRPEMLLNDTCNHPAQPSTI